MKIILSAKSVYPFHPVGGVQKYVYYFAKHLARKGVDLEIVAPLDGGKPRSEVFEGLKYTFLKPSIYKYLEYPVGWFGVHRFSQSLNRYLKRASFDILHSFDMTGYQYLRNVRRKPVIAHIFTDNYLCNPITLNNPMNLLNFTGSRHNRIKEAKIKLSPFADRKTKAKYALQYWMKVNPMHQCLSRADRIFFEADLFMDEVNDLFQLNRTKGRVIPVGTDVSYIRETAGHDRLLRKKMGFKDGDVVLITVNRLAADKGVDRIVLALEKIVEENPHVKLIIVGQGYQEKEIKTIIKNKNLEARVRHVKNVPEQELYQYYDAADLYLSVFSYPGSSISTLEAMACSLPVITTAQPWLIKNNGLILQDNSVDSIKDAVLGLVRENKLKAQGKISRDIVREYGWENIASKALEQYEQMMNLKAYHYGSN